MRKINEFVLLRPWAMKEETLSVMSQIIERHMRGENLSADEIAARIGLPDKTEPSGYEVINGVAHIPIYGIIAKRSNMVTAISHPRGTSVEQIQKDFLSALNDPAVNTILLDVDSPGGSVGGVSELSDMIFEARGKKSIIAFANGQMDSAAYWIGSAAEKIFAAKSSEVGSIGVYTILSDYSVWYHNEGIKKQVVKAGKFKSAGDPSKPLTDDEKAVIQEEINSYYDLFVEAVARNRGMSRDDVLALADGRVYIGQKAKDVRLIDGIKSLESFFTTTPVVKANKPTGKNASKEEPTNGSTTLTIKEDEIMSGESLTIERLKAEHKPIADTLIAEGRSAGLEEGKKIGFEDGKKAGEGSIREVERKRLEGIFSSMPPGAEKIAIEAAKEGLSIEQAKDKFLKAITNGTIKSIGPDNPEAQGAKPMVKEEPDIDGKKHLDRAKAYQKENKCSMTEALQATAVKSKK